MSVGIGIVGRQVTLNLGGAGLVGVNSKGITLTNESGDTTDDDSSGYVEKLAIALLKSAELTVSGIVKNLELVNAYAGTSQIFPIVKTYPDGSTLSFNVFMDSVSQTGESNGLYTYDASFSSTGVIAFVAGT